MFGKSKVTKQQIAIIYKSKYFDPQWYLEQNADINRKKIDPALHYLKYGWKELRAPSREFDIVEYQQQYPECKICPLIFEHNRNEDVYLSIVAIMKNEAPYVKEWIEYHLLVGVDRFYIYDNESTDNLKEVLQPYIETGIVIYTYWPGRKEEGVQGKAYENMILKYKDNNRWVGIIDADEFILPMKDKDLKEFLKKYEKCVGVGINWIMYDSNNHFHKPNGGILENYTRVRKIYDNDYNARMKSIVNPRKVQAPEGHNSIYKENLLAVDEYYRPIRVGDKKDIFSVDKIRINHYWSKSYEEYSKKIKKPRCNGIFLTENKSQYNFINYTYDYSIMRYVIRMSGKSVIKEIVRYVICIIKNAFLKDREPKCINRENCSICDILEQSKYFNKRYYDKKYKLKNRELRSSEHYITEGWKLGYNPSKYFDTNAYLEAYPDIKKANMCPLYHYLNWGKKEGRKAFPVKSR